MGAKKNTLKKLGKNNFSHLVALLLAAMILCSGETAAQNTALS